MAKPFMFLAGSAKFLMFVGQNLVGVGAASLSTAIDFSTIAEEIRAGAGNVLLGQYFHDSNMNVTIEEASFDLDYLAMTLGSSVVYGGTSWDELQITAGVGGAITLPRAPVAFGDAVLAWYKKPVDTEWSVIAVTGGNTLNIPGAVQNDVYCVKYPYTNENAKSMVIKANYVPNTVHLVMIADLFSGLTADIGSSSKYGRVIYDIPYFQFDGNNSQSLTSTTAATMSLTGKALAIGTGTTCDDEPVYGTITQEIVGAQWQNDVAFIAVEGGDVELGSGDSETLAVRVIYKSALSAAQRKANSNFTFAVEATPAATATGVSVSPDGVITAGSVSGTAIISVNLTGHTDAVEPAYVKVTVA